MILLEPEKINFKISTTGLAVSYDESCEAKVEVNCLILEDFSSRTPRRISIIFELVAEITCISLNFYEANHENYEILMACSPDQEIEFWEKNNFHPDSGLYQFEDLDNQNNKMQMYDPLGRINLKSFILIGNDSYVAVVARGYRIEV